MLAPYRDGQVGDLHVNGMGVIPKGHTPGKWQLITDISYPAGESVNDSIDASLCSLQYMTVEAVANRALRLGKGALLAKLDIKSVYRFVPVHPSDWKLLGIRWRGALYVDCMLLFSLRSAPKIFTAVADALEWIILQRGITAVDHYLDDFVTMGPPNSTVGRQNLELILAVCANTTRRGENRRPHLLLDVSWHINRHQRRGSAPPGR